MPSFDLLPDVDAAEMRAMQQENMPHTCALYNVTETTNSEGATSMTRVQPAVYSGPCRLSSMGDVKLEQVLAGAISAPDRYRVILPAGTLVARTQELDVSGVTRTDDGNIAFAMTLDIEGIEPGNTAIEITRKAVAKVRA
jgi:uncharacterized protein DUF6093